MVENPELGKQCIVDGVTQVKGQVVVIRQNRQGQYMKIAARLRKAGLSVDLGTRRLGVQEAAAFGI